jgi:hypothetical protein
MALGTGRHVYTEKPLSHNVFEARRCTEAAAGAKKVSQLGTQIHAGDNYRRVVELIRAGAIGPVREAHVFVNKNWGMANERPAGEYPPVPEGLNYDAWLGPAEAWPYHGSGCRPTGGAGGTSATARSATWAATTWTCRSGRWT